MSQSSVDLKVAIAKIEALPTMPVIAQRLLELDLESNEGELAMLKLIEKDPQISAKLIGLANTPFFGATKPIVTLMDAAMLLGIERVKIVALGIACMTSMVVTPNSQLDVKALWLHSFQVAIAMRTLSRAMPSESRPYLDEIFFAGLLHDIGYMVLHHLDPLTSDTLHHRFNSEPERLACDIEAELLDLNHCELGAELARHWNLPDTIVTVLRYHHDPMNPRAAVGQTLAVMVYLAEKILQVQGFAEHVDATLEAEDWLRLGIAPEMADELIQQVIQQAAEARLAS